MTVNIRWQPAFRNFPEAVQPVSANDMIGRECMLIWVDKADWLATRNSSDTLTTSERRDMEMWRSQRLTST